MKDMTHARDSNTWYLSGSILESNFLKYLLIVLISPLSTTWKPQRNWLVKETMAVCKVIGYVSMVTFKQSPSVDNMTKEDRCPCCFLTCRGHASR